MQKERLVAPFFIFSKIDETSRKSDDTLTNLPTPARWFKRCGFQQLKEVMMKDCEYTHVNSRVRMRKYPTGEYGITFLGGGSNGWYYEFSKDHKLKYKQHRSAYGIGKAVKNKASNWKDFKCDVDRVVKEEKLPAHIMRLVKWRFSNPPTFKYVEEHIGCITYFKKMEVK